MTIPIHTAAFAPAWCANVLPGPPLIAPARHYTFPRNVPGEEEALARGALWVHVAPAKDQAFLAQCALGFSGEGVAHGLWSAPEPDELWAVAGGYAYQIPTSNPERTVLLSMRPVVAVHVVPQLGILLFAGFHSVYVRGKGDLLWQSDRLSWEGITVTGVHGDLLLGTGWHLRSDRELPFALNLRTRKLTGGAFLP